MLETADSTYFREREGEHATLDQKIRHKVMIRKKIDTNKIK